ncbi:MAG: protein O-mannosyl-transferase family [Vulcanimicrobiaceae bacterium]
MKLLRSRRVPEVVTGLLAAGVYVTCAPSQPFGGDAAEMQAVPYILGIAHPTGFPLFVLLGFLWSHALAFGSVAWRINVLCALCAGSTVGLGVACARRLGIRSWIAVPAYLWYACTYVVWTHATHADVHDLLLALETAIVYATIVWLQDGERWALVAMAALWGLALADHPNAIWLAPGLLLALLLRHRNLLRRDVLRAGAAFGAGLCLYLYLPLRSSWIVAHGLDPTARLAGIGGGLFWNAGNPSTLRGFLAVLTGSSFDTGHHLLTILSPLHWQRYLWNIFTLTHGGYGSYAVVVAIFGLATCYARDRRTTVVIGLLCLAAIPFSVTYRDVESDVARYRLLAIWWVPLLLAGAGGFGDDWRAELRRAGFALFAIASFIGTLAANQAALFDNRNADGERHLITRIAAAIPRRSIVVTAWLDATPYAYGAYADGSFADRIVVAAWPNDAAAHFHQWSSIEPVYVVVPQGTVLADGTYSVAQTIDRYHVVYRYDGPLRPRPSDRVTRP